MRPKTFTFLSLGSLILALASGCAPIKETPVPQAPTELSYAQQLQSALDQALRDGQGAYDLGISAAVIVPGYQPWVGVAGNSQPGAPLANDMLFNVGSIAKSFEAALALKLAEEGLLNLDEPISKWLPAYDNIDSRITVRQLMNHTSGVFNVFEHPDFPYRRCSLSRRNNRLCATIPEPGSQATHANCCAKAVSLLQST